MLKHVPAIIKPKRLCNAWQMIRTGHYKDLLKGVQKHLKSETLSFGLGRNIDVPFQAPSAKIAFHIRLMEDEDVEQLLEQSSKHPVPSGTLSYQRRLVDAEIPNCYVAVTTDGTPCYMQWLIGYRDQDKIDEHFYKGVFPPLKEGEALLEGAYGSPRFRGLGLMPAAMARIAERAVETGAKQVITFVNIQNLPSLKGCERSGFEPLMLRRDRWFLFRRSISFHPLSEEMMEFWRRKISGEKKQSLSQAFTAEPAPSP